MEIPVLFENTELIVINKPQGVLTHGDGRSTEDSLSEWLIGRNPKLGEVGEPWVNPQGMVIPRPGIVHRLDKETSGVLVIAKNQEMYAWLKEQFKNRTVKKEYRTFVHGIVIEAQGKIDRPIGRSAADFRKYSAQRGAKGEMRDAVTRYQVLQRFTHNTGGWDHWNSNGYTYLALFPETGRTHQLRVHMKAIHHPVVADTLYGPSFGPGIGFERLALHALRLDIPYKDGTRQVFEAPLRAEYLNATKFV